MLSIGDVVGGKVIVNGIAYEGDSITIVNGVVEVGGKALDIKSPTVNIQIEGDVGVVMTTSGDITVSGSVEGTVSSTSGDIQCGDVLNNVSTTSGDVHAENIKGRVTTVSGDIYRADW